MGELTGEQIIANALKTQGVEHGFGVVRSPVSGIAGAMLKEGMTYHGLRHEMPATYAAQTVT